MIVLLQPLYDFTMCAQSVRLVLSKLYEANYHRKQALFIFITLSWHAAFNWTYCIVESTGGIIKAPCIIHCIKLNWGYVWVNTFFCHQTKFKQSLRECCCSEKLWKDPQTVFGLFYWILYQNNTLLQSCCTATVYSDNQTSLSPPVTARIHTFKKTEKKSTETTCLQDIL